MEKQLSFGVNNQQDFVGKNWGQAPEELPLAELQSKDTSSMEFLLQSTNQTPFIRACRAFIPRRIQFWNEKAIPLKFSLPIILRMV